MLIGWIWAEKSKIDTIWAKIFSLSKSERIQVKWTKSEPNQDLAEYERKILWLSKSERSRAWLEKFERKFSDW